MHKTSINLLKKGFKEDDDCTEIILALGNHRVLDQVVDALLDDVVGQSPLPGLSLEMLDRLPDRVDDLFVAELVVKSIT
jgi:hypothetical protein